MAMRVTATADAAEFIRTRGGQLFVWPAEHRSARLTLAVLQASVDPPPRALDFRRVEAGDFLLFLHPALKTLPEELGWPRGRPEGPGPFLPPGRGEPAEGGGAHKHDGGDARVGQAHRGVDVGVPGGAGGERGGADVGDGGRPGGADGLAADDGLKAGTGLVPCSAGGTGAWSARTRPRTCTSR